MFAEVDDEIKERTQSMSHKHLIYCIIGYSDEEDEEDKLEMT
jgi:hypothetical protein